MLSPKKAAMIQALTKALGISEEQLAAYTKTAAVFSVKVTSR